VYVINRGYEALANRSTPWARQDRGLPRLAERHRYAPRLLTAQYAHV
jgi:hypothetical protein